MNKKIIFICFCIFIFVAGIFAYTSIGLLDNKEIADIDTSGLVLNYFGYVSTQQEEDWIIMRSSEGVTGIKIFTYKRGRGEYAIAWSSRAYHNYVTADEIKNTSL